MPRCTAAWLERYALHSRPRAEQRVRFFDQYRSYVINYNLGKTWWSARSRRRAEPCRAPSGAGRCSRVCCRRHVALVAGNSNAQPPTPK